VSSILRALEEIESGHGRRSPLRRRLIPSPTTRTAPFDVDATGPYTLRERESVRGIEARLIAPDAVYVRHGGHVFAVR